MRISDWSSDVCSSDLMACGCPVVSTDCPSGPSEILDGGRFGRLVPVGDYEEMAKAIRETLEQTAAPAALAEHALRFSFDRVIDRYDRLLTRGSVEDR